MTVVAQQLFEGRDAEKVEAESADYSRLLAEIADRVLTGYQTEAVLLYTGSLTKIEFVISPWAEVITDAEVDFQFSGLSEQTAARLSDEMLGLKRELKQTLLGASLDAADWAGGVLRKQVLSRVEETLPEFKAAVDLTTENHRAHLQVVIYPVGEVVRDIDYAMRSETIPNLLLIDLKYKYRDRLNRLRGLPVAYVARHREAITRDLEKELAAETNVKQFDMTPRVTIVPSADLQADLRLETQQYKIWLEGYGDIGRDDHNLSGKAHFGWFMNPRHELVEEIDLDLKDVEWNFDTGYAYHFGKSTWTYLRRSPEHENDYRMEYDFDRHWRMRLEHYSGSDTTEYAVRYRIHEFLSGELVYSTEEDKAYFRIVGNL